MANSLFEQNIATPLVPIRSELFSDRSLDVCIKRDDLLHPLVSGNKWRKLKYNLLAQAEGYVTCGGAYSNHIYAFAAALRSLGRPGLIFVRGEEDPGNPTTAFARRAGMQLQYLSREEYRLAGQNAFAQWRRLYAPGYTWVPEGGSNAQALRGVAELAAELHERLEDDRRTYWILPTGTGGTLAGLLPGRPDHVEVLGISVLKDYDQSDFVRALLAGRDPADLKRWSIETWEALGGYAKWTEPMLDAIRDLYFRQNIPLDPVYTGKAWYRMLQLAEEGYFEPHSRLVFIHTGGLQGLAGFRQRFGGRLDFLDPHTP